MERDTTIHGSLEFAARRSPPYVASVSHGGRRRLRAPGESFSLSHLQAAAVVDGGLQGYPRDEYPVVPVDAVALAYVEAESLSRSFDYLDEVDGVLRILKRG